MVKLDSNCLMNTMSETYIDKEKITRNLNTFEAIHLEKSSNYMSTCHILKGSWYLVFMKFGRKTKIALESRNNKGLLKTEIWRKSSKNLERHL